MKISILGCGWLGLPLAEKLIELGFYVKGSTTSESKIAILLSKKITPFVVELTENQILGNITEFLNDSEILIIDIPPKLRGEGSENFVQKVKNLLSFIENSSIQKVIFISSTSVYVDSISIPTLTEESALNPNLENGKQLVEVENLIRNNSHFQSIIIRFGGLIGGDRNPIKFLTGKKEIANPDSPINFIHQEDCIGIICEMLKQAHHNKQLYNETFNAVTPFHPTRKMYYTQKAIEMNLPKPEFDENGISNGKIISSEKLVKVLDYRFKNLNL